MRGRGRWRMSGCRCRLGSTFRRTPLADSTESFILALPICVGTESRDVDPAGEDPPVGVVAVQTSGEEMPPQIRGGRTAGNRIRSQHGMLLAIACSHCKTTISFLWSRCWVRTVSSGSFVPSSLAGSPAWCVILKGMPGEAPWNGAGLGRTTPPVVRL